MLIYEIILDPIDEVSLIIKNAKNVKILSIDLEQVLDTSKGLRVESEGNNVELSPYYDSQNFNPTDLDDVPEIKNSSEYNVNPGIIARLLLNNSPPKTGYY